MNWYVKIAQGYVKPPTWGYWMDPKGRLFPCLDAQGHAQILTQLGIQYYQEAFKMGYVRLITDNKELYVNNDGRLLTAAQAQTLHRMSREFNFVRFTTDGVSGKTSDYMQFEDPQSFSAHLRESIAA